MKRIVLLLLGTVLSLSGSAQDLTVKVFQQKLSDLSASTTPRLDLNDNPCALIKVQLVDAGATFSGSVIGRTDYKVNQYWVYMPAGTKKLTVNHPKYLPLEVVFADYGTPKLESKCTYILTLATPNADKLKVNCNASRALLYVDDQYQGDVSSYYKISNGVHQIKLTADGYFDYSEKIVVSDENKLFDVKMTAKPQIPTKKYDVKGVEFTMVSVDGGTFVMGATQEQKHPDMNEKPTHDVKLSSYFIGETEVTQALWEAVMGNNPSSFKGNMQRPVEQISWDECQVFIHKLDSITGETFRLPTEAEWEYAARGGTYSMNYEYSGSNNLSTVGWGGRNSEINSHAVKSLLPNELGIYDMSGNVSEWCSDFYGTYGGDMQTNPKGTSVGRYHVIRGGGWEAYPKSCRCSSRDFNSPSFKEHNLGLRLAK